ncbi:ribosomal-processing cysteine protease Prp [Vagococcus jeotgali]|uniref:ribosomal-processing cysteine protease Prp n=1 Tax=Vagococcus jeotgali TaxID=3109030 RepID=UPI002DDBC9A2|nr:ribosomal-processing cysteine protease Prp [Vagococcus sp. B2T-5]
MIEAKFKQSKSGDYVSFEISGHAGSGPFGYDIVCAAVSALSINTVNSINQLAEYIPLVESESGYLYFERLQELSDEQIRVTNLLVESLLIGLKAIETDNKTFIKTQSE